MSKNEYVNNHIQSLSSYINRLERTIKSRDKEISSLRNLNKTIKLCNSDYYNQINTLTSKISKIVDRLDYEETNTESLKIDLLNIIFDKNIVLGSEEN